MPETRLQPSETRSSIAPDENKSERFRILIIGNDNAVNSTIFQKVCNSGGFKDRMGNLISANSLVRGEHNIEKEIVHPADVGFVFHNSCGFEPGDSDEVTKVREFITERVGRTDLRDRLHAIWYCLPGGDQSSILLPTVMEFIESARAKVPVVAIITNTDAYPDREAASEARAHEKAKLDVVCLCNVHESESNCDELIKQTAAAMNSKEFLLLFISVLRNKSEQCIEDAMKRTIIPHAQNTELLSEDAWKSLFVKIMFCPHIQLLSMITHRLHRHDPDHPLILVRLHLPLLLRQEREDYPYEHDQALKAKLEEYFNKFVPQLSSLVGSSSHLCQTFRFGVAMLSILDHLLFLSTTSTPFFDDLDAAIFRYFNSTSSLKLSAGVEKMFRGSNSIREVDGCKLSAILAANRLYTKPFSIL